MRQAQDVVYAKTGIWLRPEIELLGRWTTEERAALEGAPLPLRQAQDERAIGRQAQDERDVSPMLRQTTYG
jgi:hypothetical protein